MNAAANPRMANRGVQSTDMHLFTERTGPTRPHAAAPSNHEQGTTPKSLILLDR